jgi:hypothetical protein
MEFAKKQYDGPFEVVMVELQIEDQMLKGILYFPSTKFKGPHPIIIYSSWISSIIFSARDYQKLPISS